MSRTRRESKGPGYEFWASRLAKYRFWELPGALTKLITHRRERRRGARELRRDPEEAARRAAF